MITSWSQKLFFFFNRQHGKWPWFDAFMIFCAKYLIFIQIIGIAGYVYLMVFGNYVAFDFFAKDTMFLVAISLITSYSIGWVVPHRRPIREFPETHLLFHTMKTWKSFPSDHTIISFGVWGMLAWFQFEGIDTIAPIGYSNNSAFLILFLLFACLVGFSRIYCGVHYPRDILGGMLLVGFYIWLFELSEFWWNILFVNGIVIAAALFFLLLFGYHRRIIRFFKKIQA